MTVAHEVIRQSKEPDVAVRQLATDILYALDAVGVLVSEVYKLEASIGLIGPLYNLLGARKRSGRNCGKIVGNCGKTFER